LVLGFTNTITTAFTFTVANHTDFQLAKVNDTAKNKTCGYIEITFEENGETYSINIKD
jgi:hypothetical protein